MNTLVEDAVTRGELQFAIVSSFNSMGQPAKGRIDPQSELYYGDSSGDMTGTVRLMDGTTLPFAYIDGRFPLRDDIYWDEEGYSPMWGGFGMSWPYKSAVLMVEVAESRVRRWTWPGVILGDAYKVNDHRYLTPPDYGKNVRFPGLHCLVDRQLFPDDTPSDMAREWQEPLHHFPFYTVYVGHHVDGYLPFVQSPDRYVVFKWDAELGMSRYVAGQIAAY